MPFFLLKLPDVYTYASRFRSAYTMLALILKIWQGKSIFEGIYVAGGGGGGEKDRGINVRGFRTNIM